QFRQYAGQNAGNLNGYNDVPNVGNQVALNPRVQNFDCRKSAWVQGYTECRESGNENQNLNGNGNQVATRAEGNVAGHNGNQIKSIAADLDEFEKVNANCILMANLQQASTSGTQTEKPPLYDSDGSAEAHDYENYDDYEIFNMFTQKEQYTELLEPIPEPHQVPHNDNNAISKSVYQEQCLSKKIDALHLNFGKQIMTLNE
nr:hypothetical protein [Tanacetum cinerariifolium]